mmetsp:Transcript_30418/g.101048  ORF Transcript_30418/g.101048 Transcript_30418/m.101048 type:complete len:171 (-) Transcript_30418:72-584(-)
MWFQRLWNEQVVWMEERLLASSADWHVVVTHFPPQYHVEVWARLAEMYAIDLIVTGHRHQQEVSGRDPKIGQAAWVVSGGGGGITSEGSPCKDGNDDMYGFFDVTISHERIKLEACLLARLPMPGCTATLDVSWHAGDLAQRSGEKDDDGEAEVPECEDNGDKRHSRQHQ